METLRFGLAVILVVLVPMVIGFWIVIHGGSSLWKKCPSAVAYSAAGLAMLVIGLFAYVYRAFLVGDDLGMNWPVFIVGLVIYVASLKMAAPVRRHLTFQTFAGVPEVSNTETRLLIEGPYAAVRHPRYFMVLVGIVGWAMMAHHSTAYLVAVICLAGMMLVVQMEERELRTRFGTDYVDYSKRVPQILPRFRALKHFL